MPQSHRVAAAHAELARQDAEVDQLVTGATVDRLIGRTEPGRWSVAEHLQHLARVNGPYLREMKSTLRESLEPDAPPLGRRRRPLFMRLMIWWMEPPPRLRLKTMQAMEPQGEGLDLATALRDFERAQAGFRILLDDLGDAELRRVTFRSPFASMVPLTLEQGLDLLLAHNRRHLWLCHEALDQLGSSVH
jgi:uncharacterized damage-inducible protein DinB